MTSSIPDETVIDVHPVQQNTNNVQNSQSELPWWGAILVCLFFLAILFLILFLILFIYLVIFTVIFNAITSDTIPGVDVHDVTLTRFMLSPTNNTLYFYAATKITFRNPYSRVGIQFDKIDAELMYQGQQLGTKEMPDVFLLQANQEKSLMNVVLRGERVLQLIHADEKLVYESESKIGIFKIGVKVRIVIRAKTMSSYTDQYTYKIMRDNMEVPLISSSEEVLSAI